MNGCSEEDSSDSDAISSSSDEEGYSEDSDTEDEETRRRSGRADLIDSEMNEIIDNSHQGGLSVCFAKLRVKIKKAGETRAEGATGIAEGQTGNSRHSKVLSFMYSVPPSTQVKIDSCTAVPHERSFSRYLSGNRSKSEKIIFLLAHLCISKKKWRTSCGKTAVY